MLVIQLLVNQILSGPDFECGCKCTVCCEDEALTNCRDLGPGDFCNPTTQFCGARDAETCGLEYSEPGQSGFCAIDSPAEWPPTLPLPRPWRRADQSAAPRATFLYTGDDRARARAYTEGMIPSVAGAADPLDPAAPSAQGFLAASQAGAAEAVERYGFSLFAILRGIAGRQAADPSGAPLLGTSAKLRVPRGVLFQDSAWLEGEELATVARDCGAVLAWARAAADAASPGLWDSWNAVEEDPDWTDEERAAALARPRDPVWYKASDVKTLTCVEALAEERADPGAVESALYCGYFFAAGCGKEQPAAAEYAMALDWRDSGPGRVAYRMWHNTTDPAGEQGGGGPGQPDFWRWSKAHNAALEAWVDAELGPGYGAAHKYFKEMPKGRTKLTLDFSSLLGPLFFVWVLGMPFPAILQSLVYEKENRLRVMMRMHGLSSNTYFFVTYVWWALLTFLYSLLLYAFGALVGLNFFTRTDLALQLVLYAVTAQHAQIGLAFLFSTVLKSTKTATVFGNLWVFGSGILAGNLMEPLIVAEKAYVPALELLPPFGLYRGLYEMSQYAFRAVYRGEQGLSWGDLGDANNGAGRVMWVFVLEFLLFITLAWYLEQVVDDSTGVRRRWTFLWDRAAPGYRRDRTPPADGAALAGGGDVAEERLRAHGLGPADAGDYPIIVKDLHKVYPGRDGNPPKTAVQSLSMAVRRGEVLGLLGPNGAGKTTAINMLVGFMEPTAGSAMVCGHDLEEDIDAIYSLMGVCPQHDILWHTLTGREHLMFYGRLKSVPKDRLRDEVDAALRAVNLLARGDDRVGQYSGGMKRRLSVAISIIGSPSVVYMDEPSTGLDPASRRSLWDVVKSAGRDKAIILTTHSMQEAEVLCDRLGIFVDGRLFTIGNPRAITAAYGGYITLSVTVAEDDAAAAEKLVRGLHPAAEIVYEVGGTVKAKIPGDVPLSAIFKAVEKAKGWLEIADWAVQHASLEDVFIEIAREAGAIQPGAA